LYAAQDIPSRRQPGNGPYPLSAIRAIGLLRDRSRLLHEERWLIRQLRKSVSGRGPIKVARVPGGLSNHNFAVESEGRAWFARICQERPLLGIDRRNEVVCLHAASARGLAPEVVHQERGLLVTRYIQGRTLAPDNLHNPTVIARLVALLRHLHEGWDVLTGEVLYFCPFQTVRTYAETAARLGATLPPDINELLSDARQLARQIAPFRPVLCHNDLMPANLLDDGLRLWLVDWEYAGAGHPLFDLANASANAGFNDEEDRVVLDAYLADGSLRILAEFQVFKAISFLRESLWSTIQTVASDIDFDYSEYASQNLAAYRAARERLQQFRQSV
jgi:thiamine kinase-like enzyme